MIPKRCYFLVYKIRYLLEFHLQQAIQTHRMVKYIKGPVQHVNRQNLNSLPFAINIAFNTRFGTIPHLLGNHLLNIFLIGFVMFCTGPVCRWWSVSRTSHLVNWQFRSSLWYIYIGTSLITPPLSFLTVAHPLGTNFVLSPSFRCCKNQRGSYNFHRDDTEHSSA